MKKRLFIAINPPAVAQQELTKVINKLKKINPQPAIRYVKPNSIHLTLHFLGQLNSDQISRVKEVLKNLTKTDHQTKLITGKIDAFPNLTQPRVIFLSGRQINSNSLISLQKTIGQQLEKVGLDISHRSWQPHLTIARIKSPCQFKTDQLKLRPIEIPIKSLELMESRLQPQGADYNIIASYAFKN